MDATRASPPGARGAARDRASTDRQAAGPDTRSFVAKRRESGGVGLSSSVVEIFQALIAWLLPEELPEDVREQSRSHLLVGTLLANTLFVTPVVVAFFALFPPANPGAQALRWTAAGGAVFALISVLAFFRITGRWRVSGNLVAFVGFAAVVGAAWMTGGPAGPVPVLLLFVPASATLLVGRGAGLAWGGITLCTLVGLWALDANGFQFTTVVPPENLHRASLLVLIVTAGLVIGALQVYDYQADRLAEQLQIERNRFAYMAEHDPLTKLPNRATFEARLSRAIARTRRLGIPFALAYLDLDGFKPVNDRLGHPAGDAVLCRIADRLQAITRENDMAARLGGDEFAVLIEGVGDPGVIEAVLWKLSEAISRPIEVDGHRIGVSASIGAVLHPETPGTPEILARLADEAMYEAKNSGGVYVVHGLYRG